MQFEEAFKAFMTVLLALPAIVIIIGMIVSKKLRRIIFRITNFGMLIIVKIFFAAFNVGAGKGLSFSKGHHGHVKMAWILLAVIILLPLEIDALNLIIT